MTPRACELVTSTIISTADCEIIVAQRRSLMGVVRFDYWREDLLSTRVAAGDGYAYPSDVHFSVDLEAARASERSEHADVLRLAQPRPVEQALTVVDKVLRRFPGCLVVVVRATAGGCVIGHRNGERGIAVPSDGPQRSLTAREFSALASCLHTVLVLGGTWAPLRSLRIFTPAVAENLEMSGPLWLPVTIRPVAYGGVVPVSAA